MIRIKLRALRQYEKYLLSKNSNDYFEMDDSILNPTVTELITKLGIPEKEWKYLTVVVNGNVASFEMALKDGDVVTLLPLLLGG